MLHEKLASTLEELKNVNTFLVEISPLLKKIQSEIS